MKDFENRNSPTLFFILAFEYLIEFFQSILAAYLSEALISTFGSTLKGRLISFIGRDFIFHIPFTLRSLWEKILSLLFKSQSLRRTFSKLTQVEKLEQKEGSITDSLLFWMILSCSVTTVCFYIFLILEIWKLDQKYLALKVVRILIRSWVFFCDRKASDW